MSENWQPEFIWAACQHGANAALKRDAARRLPECKAAFSRPGFVTFKLDPPSSDLQRYEMLSTLARRVCFSLGKVEGDSAAQVARDVWALPTVAEYLANQSVGGLHVWQRDERPPGERGFEPGPTPLANEVRQALLVAAGTAHGIDVAAISQEPCRRNRWVLDVLLVEPGEWWIGAHRAASRAACWPGGVPQIELPERAVSRAYLKMAEALRWSSLPIARGEVVVELGCAPGGAAQALLESGATVIGVDPAEVDPAVVEHPQFTHVRRRTTQLPQKFVKDAHWLAADMNVAPNYTLDAVEAVLRMPTTSIRGMLLTCKLPQWELMDEIDAWIDRIRGWGYQDVRLRQLAFNRQEICIAALRSRAQRRVLCGSRRQFRGDSQHNETPAPHFDVSKM